MFFGKMKREPGRRQNKWILGGRGWGRGRKYAESTMRFMVGPVPVLSSVKFIK